jgi:hypothetical protein
MFNYQDLLKRIDQAGSPQGLPQMPQSMVGVDPSGGINNVQAAMQQGMMPPVPTAVPQMQPATQQQATQQMQPATQQQPGLLSRIGTGFQNLIQDKDKMQDLQALFNSMSFSPDAGIQQSYVDRQKTRQASSQANQTAAYLRQQGQPELAAMVEANPALAKEALAEFTKKKMGTSYAAKNIGSIQVAETDMMVGDTQLKAGDQYVITYNPNVPDGYSVTPLGTKAPTQSERAALEISTAEKLNDSKLAQTKGIEIDQKISSVNEQIYIMSNMLDLLNSDAPEDQVNTGFLQSFMPTVSAGTARFESMANVLGIAVINSATFGALSAKELTLALDTAIPQNLNREQMKQYIADKINATEKLMDAMLDKQNALLTAGSYKQFQENENAKMKENLKIMKQVPDGVSREEWRNLTSDQRRQIIALGD